MEDGGTSLVVQWLRICLPMQGTQVASLVAGTKIPPAYGATKPVCHKYRSPCTLEPMLCNKRSHSNE